MKSDGSGIDLVMDTMMVGGGGGGYATCGSRVLSLLSLSSFQSYIWVCGIFDTVWF